MSPIDMNIVRTRLIHVKSDHEECELLHRPWMRSSASRVVVWCLLLACALILLSSINSPVSVHGARAKQVHPHLLHVAVAPLELHSVYAPSSQPHTLQMVDEWTLIRLFFDRSLDVHSMTELKNGTSMNDLLSITCHDQPVPLSTWSDGSAVDSLSLVIPVEPWMDFFDDSAIDEDDEDGDDDDRDGGQIILPRGAVGAGGSPFASNSFGLMLALPPTETFASLQDCTLNLWMDQLMASSMKATKPTLLHIPLKPRAGDATQNKKPTRQRSFGVKWSEPIRTTRFILPAATDLPEGHPSLIESDPDSNHTKLSVSCASLREEQRIIFLENGVSSVGAILGPIVSTMMAPVIDQFEQTSTVQTAEEIAKNYVTTISGSIPPETSHFVSQSLSTGVTDIVVGLLTTSLTDSCSSSIAAALGAYLTRSVSEDVGEIVNDHVLGALTQLIPPDLSKRLAKSVAKKLPQQIVKDVSMSLTHTLVGSLSRGLSNFNHMQKMCRMCALHKYRCSDCRYVQDTAKKLTSYSAQYSHYYAGYYSEFYAPIAGQMKIGEDGGGGGDGGDGGDGGGGDE